MAYSTLKANSRMQGLVGAKGVGSQFPTIDWQSIKLFSFKLCVLFMHGLMERRQGPRDEKKKLKKLNLRPSLLLGRTNYHYKFCEYRLHAY